MPVFCLFCFFWLTHRFKSICDEMMHLHEPKIHKGDTDLDIWLLPCSSGRYDSVLLRSHSPGRSQMKQRRFLPLQNLWETKQKGRKKKSSHDCPEWLIYLKDMTAPPPPVARIPPPPPTPSFTPRLNSLMTPGGSICKTPIETLPQ